MRIKILLPGLALLFLIGCSNPQEPAPKDNSPADHTVSKDGFKHKTGLNDPLTNCISCHGDDLRGGTAGISCFQCHGKKW